MSNKRRSKNSKNKRKSSIKNMGAKIMNLAKEIRKNNPNLKWTECVSKAAKQLKK